MRLLLDTHIWIWSLLAPDRLSRRVTRELEKPGNELWLSPVSTWELAVLCQKGRIVLDQDVEEWVATALRTIPCKEAPLTHEIALETLRLRLPHNDPADRLLLATARVLGLTLVTGDDRLIRGKEVPVLANRSGPG